MFSILSKQYNKPLAVPRICRYLLKLSKSKSAKHDNDKKKFAPKSPEAKGGQKVSKQKKITKTKVTLIEGDGVGPEICTNLKKVYTTAKVPIKWEKVDLTMNKNKKGEWRISDAVIKSFLTNKVGLAGPISRIKRPGKADWFTTLRKQLNLFANVVVCRTLPGYETPYGCADIVIIRDQTEGEYSGIEHVVVPGVIQSIKLITEHASRRLAAYVFNYAKKHHRRKVTVAHKANIMCMSDGLFSRCLQEAADNYHDKIHFEQRYLDTVCMRLLLQPDQNDILVAPSMYGDILSDVAAGIIGGLPLSACFNVGQHAVMYDCAHDAAEDIVGCDQANPTSMLLSSIIMLKEMGLRKYARKIEKALYKVIEDGKHLPRDMHGKAKASEFTCAICEKLS